MLAAFRSSSDALLVNSCVAFPILRRCERTGHCDFTDQLPMQGCSQIHTCHHCNSDDMCNDNVQNANGAHPCLGSSNSSLLLRTELFLVGQARKVLASLWNVNRLSEMNGQGYVVGLLRACINHLVTVPARFVGELGQPGDRRLQRELGTPPGI